MLRPLRPKLRPNTPWPYVLPHSSHTLAQHFVDALSFDVNPVEYLLAKFPTCGVKPEGMRQLLGRFGLGGAHHLTPICKLSGGQKVVQQTTHDTCFF